MTDFKAVVEFISTLDDAEQLEDLRMLACSRLAHVEAHRGVTDGPASAPGIVGYSSNDIGRVAYAYFADGCIYPVLVTKIRDVSVDLRFVNEDGTIVDYHKAPIDSIVWTDPALHQRSGFIVDFGAVATQQGYEPIYNARTFLDELEFIWE